MKSKRAKEYVKTIKLNKANVDYCLEHGRVNGFLLIDIENAVELAERDAEEEIEDKCKGFVEILETLQEEHEQQIEALKKRAVEAFRESCPIKHPGLNDEGALCDKINIIGFDCNCPVSDCKFLLNFLQKLNER